MLNKDIFQNGSVPLFTQKKQDIWTKFTDQTTSKEIIQYLRHSAFIASCLWAVFMVSYSVGIISYYPKSTIPFFLTISLIIATCFPIAMIWFGYITYKNIKQNQEVSNSLLEAARVLSSPALLAADDVKKLSSAISDEMNEMRHALREVEDRLLNIRENIPNNIKDMDASQLTPSPVTQKNLHVNSVTYDHSSNEEHLKKDIENQLNTIIQQENITPATPYKDSYQTKPLHFEMTAAPALKETPEEYLLSHERQLYEGLYALTVDLNRVMDTQAPQELWPQYMKGDRNVFAYFFCDWVHQNYAIFKEKSMSEEYQHINQRFLSQYDILNKKMMDTPYQEIKEYLHHSGIGKIYQILSTEHQTLL